MGLLRLRQIWLLACVPGILLGWVHPALGQKVSNWRVYRAADGMPETPCASVTIGSHGRILVKHVTQPFVTHLDGYSMRRIPAPETNARKIYESPAGQLWVPTHRGLLEFKDGGWELNEVPEIAAHFASAPQRLMTMPIRPVRQGLVLFLLPEALVAYNARELSEPGPKCCNRRPTVRLAHFGSLIPGSGRGLGSPVQRHRQEPRPPAICGRCALDGTHTQRKWRCIVTKTLGIRGRSVTPRRIVRYDTEVIVNLTATDDI